jgi:type II secretory pathway pseudopilin PulG
VRYQQNQSGFTFLELVSAAAFIGVAFLAVIQIFMAITGINRQARNITDAKQIAQEKIEEYRNSAYIDIPLGTPAVDFTSELPDTFENPRSAVINVTQVETGLKKIDVNISYKDGPTKNIQLSTYVTEEGINR